MLSGDDIYETRVFIDFHKIGHVDTKHQTFSATVEIRAIWDIPLLPPRESVNTFISIHEHEKQMGFQMNEVELKRFEEFIPKLLVLNLEDTKSEKSMYRFAVNHRDNMLRIDLRWHLKGTFHEQMELQDFPFDVQDLCVRLHLDDRSKEHFYLEAEDIPGLLNEKAFQDHQEWVLYKMVLTGENNVDSEEQRNCDDVLVLRCNVQRKFKYFVYNCFLVMFFFAVMSLCNFTNRPEHVQFRVSGTLTLVLTSVAYKLMLSNTLPTISYLTLVDFYVLFAILMLTVLVVAFSVLHLVFRTSDLEGEEREEFFWHLDVWTVSTLALVYFLWNVGFGILAIAKTRNASKKLKNEEQIYTRKLIGMADQKSVPGLISARTRYSCLLDKQASMEVMTRDDSVLSVEENPSRMGDHTRPPLRFQYTTNFEHFSNDELAVSQNCRITLTNKVQPTEHRKFSQSRPPTGRNANSADTACSESPPDSTDDLKPNPKLFTPSLKNL
ncbi:gamma-aminobutyric acid receptor subunit epsilon-like isoform X2 [Symsagittifera roscoffensis]|uniref:gamma-aminobutyric acid receptor subunit epsilon-like isoform X2 n=1 Tax=Symsagittifera roscoffensis TaxID=84072 RepID=UPI00307B992C